MTIRLSTGMANSLLNGGASNGLKAGLAAGFIAIYQGTQPADADTGAGATLLLGTVTNLDDGVTGIQFDNAVAGVSSKAAAQTWRFHGLAAGVAGWFRIYEAAGNPANTSATEKRIDGAIGTSGGDINITNTTIAIAAQTTIDAFTVTQPKS